MTDMESMREELHGVARVQVALARMDGAQIDKRVCRFNEIVETAIRYGMCGATFSPSVVRAGLQEAIDCCVIGDPMHTGASCLSLVPDWMIAA